MDSNAKFERAIAFSLKWEGGRNFTIQNGKPIIKGNAKADLGGATAYGITWSTLKTAHRQGVINHDDICRLTQDEAKLIYKANFWDKYHWDELEWPVCLCCLDCCINHGGFASILQRAANSLGQNLAVDGKFGPKTFAGLKACDPKELAEKIHAQRKIYYEKIIARNPSQAVFRTGWLRRNDEMLKACRES